MSKAEITNINREIKEQPISQLKMCKDKALEILQITDEKFSYLLKLFDIPLYTSAFTKSQVDFFAFYQRHIKNQTILAYSKEDFTLYPQRDKIPLSEIIKLNKELKKAGKAKDVNGNKKVTPKEHQREGIENVLLEFEKKERAQIVAACGTGKTIMAKEIADKISLQKDNSLTLIFVPSLALASQFYKVWVKHSKVTDHKKPFIICSDKETATIEEASINLSNLKFIVNTSEEFIKGYLIDKTINHKLLFVTYQSTLVLANAMRALDMSATIGIFDEAHKTSGDKDKEFALALFDENIKIKKRLFMTATQKQYQDKNNFLSMDDEDVYGKVAYHLPMRKAISKGIIKDYKIVLGVITSKFVEDVKKLEESKSSDSLYVDVLVTSYLKVLIEKGIKKSILFSSRIEDSKSIVNNNIMQEALGSKIEHIDGMMNNKVIQKSINELMLSEEKHISNAKLFSEGIDIPSVSMVGFLSPTRSIVDIVQRLGRMQRKEHENDTEHGYIFLPIFLDEALVSIGNITTNSYDWDYIVEVLSYLKEADEQIKILFNDISGSTQENNSLQKRTKEKEIELIVKDKFDISSVENFQFDVEFVENIINSIKISTIESNKFSWDMQFEKVVKYKQEHGKFPTRYQNPTDLKDEEKEEALLALWCMYQKSHFRKGVLSDVRANKLKEIGFSFNPAFEKWMENFNNYVKFLEIHGGQPQARRKGKRTEKKEASLLKWQNDQKRAKNDGKLAQWKIDLLMPHIEDWNTRDTYWNNTYKELMKFVNDNKALPCDKKEKHEQKLYAWLRRQRDHFTQSKLSKKRIALLNKTALPWNENQFSVRLEKSFFMIEAFIKDNHRLPKYIKDNKSKEYKAYRKYEYIKKKQENGELNQDDLERFTKILRISSQS